MPDPRNFQLVDRGIIDEMLTSDLLAAIGKVLATPEALPIIAKFLAGEALTTDEIGVVVSPGLIRDVTEILRDKAGALLSQFEQDHDPMVASVFSVPKPNLEEESLWVRRISDLDDDNYRLEAIIENADGTLRDQIQENFFVDTSAPEARVNIAVAENTTGYQNGDVFVATAPDAGAALLSITASLTGSSQIGPAEGYLLYQMVGLNEDGTPYADEASINRPNTWMPLGVQSTMLTSRVWDAIREAISGGRLELPPVLESNENLPLVLGLEFEVILDLLNGEVPEEFKAILDVLNIDVEILLRNEVNKIFADLEDLTGFSEVTDEQYQLIIDALGATVDIIDNLVPVTFDADKPVIMPIQGEQIPLMIGDYGIRAMGIDTRFNVGAYAEPTRLRIVAPVYDKATVTAATIGDRNGDGVVDENYEIGTIYANTTEGVKLTGTIDLTGHSVTSVLVQYDGRNWYLGKHWSSYCR